jgi:SulP family sulfate permease
VSRLPNAALQRFLRFGPHLRGTTRVGLRGDLLAALTVAALAIPQAIAYALVAGLPPQLGLIAAALPVAVAALFGSSPYLIGGPTNPTALVLGSAVIWPVVAAGGAIPLGDVLTTGLLVGGILIGFAVLRIGRASRFLSDSVIVGFASGAGILIALRLIPELAPSFVRALPGTEVTPAAWPVLLDALAALGSASPRALALAIGVAIAVLALRRLDARLPGPLLALAAATLLSSWLGWNEGEGALRTIGALALAGDGGAFLVDLGAPVPLFGPALAIALIVTFQSIASARAVRPPPGMPLDPDRELVGQGLGNVASALLGGMVTSGSLTRTAVARSAGARSRASAVMAGVAVAGLLPLLGGALAALPMAAIVGLVVLSGLELVSPRAIRRAATTRGDAAVLIVTLGATLWIDLVQALYVGVVLSLVLLVRRTGHLQMVELVRSTGGRFREIELDARSGTTPAVLLHLEGDLNFAVASELSERLYEVAARGPRVLILRLKRARHLDATVLEVLREVAAELEQSGVTLLLCGLTDDMVELLSHTEVGHLLGEEGLLRSGKRLFEGFELALRRTRELLDSAADEEIFRSEHEASRLYEI